jgi:hypothetical protein
LAEQEASSRIKSSQKLKLPHSTLKTGTLHGILSEVAQMGSMTLDALVELL